MTGNVTIPNSYQTPNVVVDRLYQFLQPDEIVVLTFAIRHILGWRDKIADRRGCISLSMFEDGFTTKDGTHYGGCGLTRPKVTRALKALVQHGIMTKIGKATQDGQEWALTFDDPDVVKWDDLEQRRAAAQAKAARRVSKAAKASADKRKSEEGSTTAVPPEVVRQPYPQQYDSRTTGSTTAVPKQTQVQTHDQTHTIPPSAGADALSPPSPSVPEPSNESPEATPDKPPQPHIAIIDAWYDAMPAPPIKRRYARNAAVASEMANSGVTPEQVAAFVRARYQEPYWRDKQLPLEKVMDEIPLWLKEHAPPKPIYVETTTEEVRRRQAEHVARIAARVEAGEFDAILRDDAA